MEKILSSRPRSRILPTLLAAWMMAFAVVEAVHTHGVSVSPSAGPALGRHAGISQTGVCLACLAAHHSAPAAAAPDVLPAPQDPRAIWLVEPDGAPRATALPTLPPRAPPIRSTNQA